MKRSRKIPTVKDGRPERKSARYAREPENTNILTPVWQFGLLDDGGRWSFKEIERARLWERVLPKLRDFETMTWQDIVSACGGRSRGTNNHEIPVSELCQDARRRIADRENLCDLDVLFSLRLEGTVRIWGKREGRIFKLIWYDPEHEVCPSSR